MKPLLSVSWLAAGCFTLLTGIPPLSFSADRVLGLSELYQAATVHDPDFAAAKAAYESGLQNREIGLSNLLPSISASIQANANDYTLKNRVGPSQNFEYGTQSYALRISQPLFDLSRMAAWNEGKIRAELAETTYADARQALVVRVAEAYFNYLQAQDDISVAKLQRETYQTQMLRAEKLFQAGVGTKTDSMETRARLQLSEAQLLSATNTLEQRRREVEKLVGRLPTDLRPLPEQIPLTVPEPVDLEPWLTAAENQNLSVMQQKIAVRIVETQHDQAQAGHYPTVSLTASHQIGDQPNYFSESDRLSQIGVIVNIPIYEGGKVTASSKQALSNIEKARQDLASAISDARTKTTQAYYGVLNGVAQVKALEESAKAASIAVEGMEIGHKVGIRTNTDVLNAQQQYYATRRDLLRERYIYLLNQIQLKAVVGSLQETELIILEKALGASP